MRDFAKEAYLVLLGIVLSICSFAQWEQVPIPDSVNALTIYFHEDDVYLGTTSGIYHSTDNCETWDYLGLEIHWIRAIMVTNDSSLLVGADGFVYKYLGNEQWEMLLTNPEVNNIVCLHQSDSGYLFYSGWGGIFRSVDNGATWDKVLDTWFTEMINDIECNSFGILFAGSIAHVGPNPGGMYRSDDGGSTWELIGLQKNFISCVEINSNDEVFAGSRGHAQTGLGQVFKSLDYLGNSWEAVFQHNLVTSMTINDFNTVFISCTRDGSEGGVYCSYDNGDNWEDITDNLTGRFIEYVASDFGNFVYIIYDMPGILFRTINPITEVNYLLDRQISFKVYPIPANDRLNIIFPEKGRYTIEVNDLSGRKLLDYYTEVFSINEKSIDISAFKTGFYIVNIVSDNAVYSLKFLIE